MSVRFYKIKSDQTKVEVKAIFLCLLTLYFNLISSHLLASSPLFLPTSPFRRVDHRHPTHTEPLDTTLILRGRRSVFTSSTTLFFWETADRMVEEVRMRRVALWSPAAAGGGGDPNEVTVAALLSVNMSDGKACCKNCA